MLGIPFLLQLLQAVPQAVAAAPDFKRLWDQAVATFHGHPAQQDLKDAYAAAVSDAADAHQDLQEIVARHT
jgi:ABC-type transporter Mla subunit MlaD